MCSAVLLTVMAPTTAHADVPAEVPIQAYLSDDNGVPVDGTVTVTFSIYDAASNGAVVHTEMQTLDSDAGALTAYLTPDRQIFDDHTELFLALAVDGGAEMSPRIKLATVPYAAVAGNASSLQGRTADDFLAADYQPEWDDIPDAPNYAAGSGVEIDANDTISLNSSCSTDELLKWDGSQWTCQPDADTTYTAGGGLELSGTAFSVDTSDIQARVQGSCPSGQFITGVNQDGSVVCGNDQDTDTTYTAGTGLELSNEQFSVANDGITSTQLANGAVTNAKVANGAVTDAKVSGSAAINPSKISGTAATLNSSPTFSGGVTAPSFEYSNSPRVHVPVPAAAFQVSNITSSEWIITGVGYGVAYGGAAILIAPVTLPVGSTVKGLHCYVYDNHSTHDMQLDATLKRTRIWGTGAAPINEEMGDVNINTSFQADALQYAGTVSIDHEVVEEDFGYTIVAHVQPENFTYDLRFYGCRVELEVEGPSPY